MYDEVALKTMATKLQFYLALFYVNMCFSRDVTSPIIDGATELSRISARRRRHSMTAITSTKAPQQITFVLPVTLSNSERIPLLLVSLWKFATNGTVHELIMVVPDDEKALFLDNHLWDFIMAHATSEEKVIAKYINAWKKVRHVFPTRVLGESEVLPTAKVLLCAELPQEEMWEEPRGRGCGYRLQMLIKIGVALHVHSNFYVTLDHDIFAKRKFNMSDFVTPVNEMDHSIKFAAKIQGETQKGSTQHRASWWSAAASVLQAPRNCIPGRDTPTVGVTPAVIPKRAAVLAMDRVVAMWSEKLQANNWDLLFYKLLNYERPSPPNDWTEYTTCFVAACTMGEPRLFANFPTKLYDWYEYPYYEDMTSSQQVAQSVKFGDGAIFGVIPWLSSETPAVQEGLSTKLNV